MRNIKYVIGDIHGRHDLLMLALTKIEQDVQQHNFTDEEWGIIQLGDMIDRSSGSRQVIETLMNHPKVEVILGNHEEMMLSLYHDKTFEPYDWPMTNRLVRSYMQNGGLQTFESYGYQWSSTDIYPPLELIPKEHLQWLASLPLYIETDHHFFVHAGVRGGRSLHEQDPEDLIWIRHEFFNAADCATPPKWDNKFITHGHSPMLDYEPEIKHNRCNLDTGSCWSGRQAIGVFDLDKYGPPMYILWAEIKEDEDFDPNEDLDSIILHGKAKF